VPRDCGFDHLRQLRRPFGHARGNIYMGVKNWASYLSLAWLFGQDDAAALRPRIDSALQSAALAADTVDRAWDERLGFIPAILDGNDRSAIIPVIEGLVYPAYLGLTDAVSFNGPYGALLRALRRHLRAVLRPGRCLFPDGGWKLSAGSDNSWMSKIFICQHVARAVLKLRADPLADEAHDRWWRVGCAGHSVIDQVIAGGAAGGGAIYPRCVSSFLWIAKDGNVPAARKPRRSSPVRRTHGHRAGHTEKTALLHNTDRMVAS